MIVSCVWHHSMSFCLNHTSANPPRCLLISISRSDNWTCQEDSLIIDMVRLAKKERLLFSSVEKWTLVMFDSLMLSSVICVSLMHAVATIVEGDWTITHLLPKEPCDFISIQAEAPLPYQGRHDLKKHSECTGRPDSMSLRKLSNR